MKKVRLGQDSEMESNPLSLAIQSDSISPAIRIPKEKFDGTSDPADHAADFESCMDFYGASDSTKCRAFSATLTGVARSWYDSLPAQSITSFKCLKKLFVGNFMANKRRPKNMTSLWSVTQGVNESLEGYTKRFTMTYSCVTNLNEELVIQAYISGVANENIQLSLCSNDVGSMKSLISKAYKLSDTQKMNRNRAPRTHQNDQRRTDQDRGGSHLRGIKQITDQSPQGNLFTGNLRTIRL